MSGNRIEMNPFGGKSPHVMVSEQQFHSHGNAELGPNGGGSTSTSRRQQQLMEVSIIVTEDGNDCHVR